MDISLFMFAPSQVPIDHPAPDLLFFPFSDGGLLFKERSRRIWVLNPTSAFIWCVAAGGVVGDELAKRYAQSFAVDAYHARRDVAETLAGFRREGLYGEEVAEPPPFADEAWEITAEGPPLGDGGNTGRIAVRCFALGNHSLELCCPDDSPARALVPLVEHLGISRDRDVDTRLVVVSAGGAGTWDIYLDGRRWLDNVAEGAVLPWLLTLMFVRYSTALQERLLFHAAVVGKGERMVLLPGEAGRGKTTLAAVLAARDGWTFYSDELAVLDVKNLTVAPFFLPMSIKPGSMAALGGAYPGLAAMSVYPRSDGKQVRYLLPPVASRPVAGAEGKVHGIVFPTYREGAQNRCEALAKDAALQRLVRTGSSSRELSEQDVAAMIALVEERPCFDLVFSETDAAVDVLETLVGG